MLKHAHVSSTAHLKYPLSLVAASLLLQPLPLQLQSINFIIMTSMTTITTMTTMTGITTVMTIMTVTTIITTTPSWKYPFTSSVNF